MKILVTGSIAYDTIMVFPDRFRNHLLADQLHILNVCFLAPEMRREYGGTAGNIGYNLRLLGETPLVMATVGDDIEPYLDRFHALGIATSLLKRVPGQFTAQAFITTDLDDNEIPCVEADSVADPTGCGDAYRSGLLYGLARGWDWPTTGKLGAVMGAIKVARRGAQNHAPTREEIETRFRRAFGYSPWKG